MNTRFKKQIIALLEAHRIMGWVASGYRSWVC